MAVVVCEAQEAELTTSAAKTGKHDAAHFDGNGARVLQRRGQGDDEHATC